MNLIFLFHKFFEKYFPIKKHKRKGGKKTSSKFFRRKSEKTDKIQTILDLRKFWGKK